MVLDSHAKSPNSGGLLTAVQKVWGHGPLHQTKLNGPAPDRFLYQADYPRTPDKEFALLILKGRLFLNDDQKSDECHNLNHFWSQLTYTNPFFRSLHGFEWLPGAIEAQEEDDLSHDNNDFADRIEQLIDQWLQDYAKWSPEVWSPRLAGERLMHWCVNGDYLLNLGDAMWRSRLLTSMAQQTRHLAHTAHKAEPGTDILFTAMNTLLAGLSLPFCDIAIERGLELFRRELRVQVRSDGGHISRNPAVQLELVIRLQMIVAGYERRNLPLPGFLRLALGRVAGMVQYYRCGDGGLAVMNGGYEDDSRAIICAGQAALDSAKAPEFARYSQYQRLVAARAMLLVDVVSHTGNKADHFEEESPFDGAGSFQFSSGRSRIVVNCGCGIHLDDEWSHALHQARAHSVFSVNGQLSGRWGGGSDLFTGETYHQRGEDMSGALLEMIRPFVREGKIRAMAGSERMSHGAKFNQLQADNIAGYSRRLYLAAGGNDLRGEDFISELPHKLAEEWALRFHLHPDVKASVARDGRSVILVLSNQEGWRFRTNMPGVRLEPSIYCGGGGQPTQSEQIVIPPPVQSELDPENGLDNSQSVDIIVKWAFRRLDGV